MPELRVVQSLSAGVDWLLPRTPPGVTVCKAVGVHDRPVSEWVIAVILAMQRRLPEFIEWQRLGRWDRSPVDGTPDDDLEGQTVLIVGHGSIGRTLATRLASFGVRVIGVAQHSRDDARPVSSLPDLLPQADVVVNLLPLTSATERFVDAAFLGQMKAGALFANAGRGKTVDTTALLEALQSGRVRAAPGVRSPKACRSAVSASSRSIPTPTLFSASACTARCSRCRSRSTWSTFSDPRPTRPRSRARLWPWAPGRCGSRRTSGPPKHAASRSRRGWNSSKTSAPPWSHRSIDCEPQRPNR